jgi:hypothetical protein
MPVARPTRARLMKTTPKAATTLRNISEPRNSLATMVRPSERTKMGSKPVQNFDHRKCRIDMGAVRMIQNAAPSAETAGKTKRTATAAITKEARPRLRKE